MNGKRENLVLEDFLAIANSVNIKKPMNIIQKIYEEVERWPIHAQKANVDPRMISKIQENFLPVSL